MSTVSCSATTLLTGTWRDVGFRLHLPEALTESASALLPPGWEAGDVETDAASWSLRRDEAGWRAGRVSGWHETLPDAEQALARVLGDVELHVAEHAVGVIAVHAGVVVWHGAALVLPGRTLAGKSTLVHRLVTAGAQYCSDEYALLTRDGLVLPYPRPLSLRPPHGGVPSRIALAGLGANLTDSVPVALIAALEYRPGATWQVREVTAAEGAMAMLQNTVAARSRPVETMDHVSAAARGSLALLGLRGEAGEAVDRLLGLLQRLVQTAPSAGP